MRKRKYLVSATCTISLHTMVEATSKEEAIEIASQRDIPQIIDQSDLNESWSTSGELDGEPQDLEVRTP